MDFGETPNHSIHNACLSSQFPQGNASSVIYHVLTWQAVVRRRNPNLLGEDGHQKCPNFVLEGDDIFINLDKVSSERDLSLYPSICPSIYPFFQETIHSTDVFEWVAWSKSHQRLCSESIQKCKRHRENYLLTTAKCSINQEKPEIEENRNKSQR